MTVEETQVEEGGRALTPAEKQAVDRVEKALAAVPDTLALHFNEAGFYVFDRDAFAGLVESNSLEEKSSGHGDIACRYDCGAL